MSTLIELRARVTRVRQANERVNNATARLLIHERQEYTPYERLHASLRDLTESIQESRAAMSALCLMLAVEPEKLDGPLDDLVPPLMEGTTE